MLEKLAVGLIKSSLVQQYVPLCRRIRETLKFVHGAGPGPGGLLLGSLGHETELIPLERRDVVAQRVGRESGYLPKGSRTALASCVAHEPPQQRPVHLPKVISEVEKAADRRHEG